MKTKTINRRNFLQLSTLSGTALLLGFYFPATAKTGRIVTVDDVSKEEIEMCAWILVNPSGKVTLVSHRAEMGQGVYHSIAQIIAEELAVDLNEIDIKFAQGNREKYGSQITGGSSTIRGSYKNLLQLSATAREMLIAAAAKEWRVPAKDCVARSGHVYHQPSGKKFHYGELAAAASQMSPPKNVTLKQRADYKLIGKPLLRQDTPMKTNGTAVFGLDKKLPGMLYAAVERNPRFLGKVKNIDDRAALQTPGVKKVMKVKMGVHDQYREGVAVIATSTWAALQGKKALRVEWDDSGFDHVNTADLFKRQQQLLQTEEGLSAKLVGNPDAMLAQAAGKIDVVYETPYQAHSSMEPLNCIAHWQGDKVEIWGPIQAPEMVQDFINKEMGLPIDNIIVHMTFLGGGFGRKAFMDYPHEAAVIAKELSAPVQVVWSREDDMTQGPFRPGISYRCEGLLKDGNISAVKIKMAGQDLGAWRSTKKKESANWGTAEGFPEPYFKSIPHISFSDVPFDAPIPPLWWRSVYASTNGFAYDSFIDELAHAAGKDPLQFRRQYLPDERCQKLIDKMEAMSGWNKRKKAEGYGAAITECFGSTVGQVVKVSRNAAGAVQIDGVWAVMDCGWYVNPDIIKAQVEGSVVMALGAATLHEVTFEDGIAVDKNFYSYKMPRITDIPPIEVHVMDNDAEAGGVGEPGLPPFAPALANAIYDLTGKRIRKLPFNMREV